MNTWVLITLVSAHWSTEPTQAWEYTSYEECMVAKAHYMAEKIPYWKYECVPLLTAKVIKK